jgi:hypothetical protein
MSTTGTVVNLRDSRKELAAKKPAPAKKAPAKAPAKKPAATAAKIAWKTQGEKDAKGNAPATGTADGRTYAITGSGQKWTATVKVGTKTTTLAENVSAKTAWQKCVSHNRSAA